MKERTAITLFWIIVIAGLALILTGCSLANMTPDNPIGFNDPNAAMQWFQLGQSAAGGVQAVGAATGNPLLYAGGTLATLIIGAIGSVYLKGDKWKTKTATTTTSVT